MTGVLVVDDSFIISTESLKNATVETGKTIKGNLIRFKQESLSNLKKAVKKRLEAKKTELVNQQFYVGPVGEFSVQDEKIITQKTKSIARMEAVLRFLDRGEIPLAGVSNRAIKLRNRMFTCLRMNGLNAFTCVGEQNKERIFSTEPVDLDGKPSHMDDLNPDGGFIIDKEDSLPPPDINYMAVSDNAEITGTQQSIVPEAESVIVENPIQSSISGESFVSPASIEMPEIVIGGEDRSSAQDVSQRILEKLIEAAKGLVLVPPTGRDREIISQQIREDVVVVPERKPVDVTKTEIYGDGSLALDSQTEIEAGNPLNLADLEALKQAVLSSISRQNETNRELSDLYREHAKMTTSLQAKMSDCQTNLNLLQQAKAALIARLKESESSVAQGKELVQIMKDSISASAKKRSEVEKKSTQYLLGAENLRHFIEELPDDTLETTNSRGRN